MGRVEDGTCPTCGNGIVLKYCCDGKDCRCGGEPINEPYCCDECKELYYSKLDEEELDNGK